MRIEASDNVFGCVAAICLVIILFNFGQCGLAENKIRLEEDKIHVAAGECKDKWGGTWSKCK